VAAPLHGPLEPPPQRTAIAMSNLKGSPGSESGRTAVTRSGTGCRGAKYPANGPQTIATSISPAATASMIRAGGFSRL
jgi:hypothetical protein